MWLGLETGHNTGFSPFVCLVYFVVGNLFRFAWELMKVHINSKVAKNAKESHRSEFVLLQKNIKVFLHL